MEYMQDQFPYPPQTPQQQVFYHPNPYPPFIQNPQQQLDEFYMTYGHPEFNEYMPHGPYQEDYEDMGDAPTRPRLTKHQVGILEGQFQANHKPNSMVKRQLAMQTNLSLPRVANWFQNRRAKAKQLKKQEEFENKQYNEDSQQDRPPGDDSVVIKDEDELSEEEDYAPGQTAIGAAETVVKGSGDDTSKEAGWASLQRALQAAKVAQSSNQAQPQPQTVKPMPHSDMHPSPAFSSSHVGIRHGTSTQMRHQSLPRKQSWADAWSSHRVFQDQGFDFGFAEQSNSAAYPQPVISASQPQDFIQETCLDAPGTWQDGLPTPKGPSHNQYEHSFQAPDLPLPPYPDARRGSGAESLTNNLDAFALASESARGQRTPVLAMEASYPDAQLDIAARRKRPRPAALTSASLRSRSYGAMTMSPTFRPGLSPAHTVRHVKSTGHNLNAKFSGVRKPSSAQRSPVNFSTFAEAEAFDRFMAQQAAAAQASVAEANSELHSPAPMAHAQRSIDHVANSMPQKFDLARTYQLPTTQHLTLMTSPPTTPFTAEFDPYHTGFGMPPVSAPAQYASFPDYTPPYSAGPLTNSSWSDAPLTSPDLPNFPPVTYIPSLGLHQDSDNMTGHFQEFILASDSKHEMDSMNSTSEQKKTDFFIQEFPNQKEEHANAARQVAQHKPKHYVWAHTASTDYDQS